MLTKKVFYNMAAGFLDYGLKVAVALATTPIIIQGIGSQGFGIWQMVIRFGEQLAVTDGRSNESLKWLIAERQSEDDPGAKRRLFASALIVWFAFLPLFCLIGFLALWWAPRFVPEAALLGFDLRVAMGLTIIATILATFKSFSASALIGMNLNYKSMGVMALAHMIGGITVVAAVHAGLGLSGVAASQVVTGLFGAIFTLWVAKRHIGWFGLERPRRLEIHRIFRISIWFCLWGVMESALSSDIFILGILCSPQMVTNYAVTSYPIQIITLVIVMTVSAAMPGIGGVISGGDFNRASSLRKETLSYSWLLGTALGSSILFCNSSFVALWVGANRFAGHIETLCIVLLVLQMVFIRIDAAVINLALDIRRKVIFAFISAVITLLLSFLLVPTLKIVGLCIAMFAGRLVLSITYPKIVSNFLGAGSAQTPLRYFRLSVVTVLIFAGTWLAGKHIHMLNWPILILGAASSGFLSLLIAFFVGFGRNQRLVFLSRFRTLFA
ncbi:MAG: hypothetical protein KKB23_04410 [Proteobacteria bacterium]|nr:hypothetical protein [Pseudomonadota bacterium]MBU4388764.1 hypothetical protein [Pseudomonadota bacterium]